VTSPGAPVEVAAVIARYRPELEASLRASLPTSGAAPELFDLLRYHLGWLDLNLRPTRARTGKLLRPTICFLACEAVGADYHRALPAATALELLHNFSLIHDDVEDRGDERHGRPTVWKRWGEPLAVNAGDALLIVSELTLANATSAGLTAEETLQLVCLLNRCCLELTEGQHLDMTLEANPAIAEEQYFQIISRKTAALLGCSAQLGALSGGADAERADAFRAFGTNLGVGFQIQDDLLGIWGDPATTGKPPAADVFGHKVTLPVIDAIGRASLDDRRKIEAVYRSPQPSPEDVGDVVRIMTRLGARERAESVASEFVARALADLERAAPAPAAGDALVAVAESLIGRKF
jgi:geranylgeranyl diphosphate synthase type I